MRKGGYVPASFWRRRFLEGASADVRLLALYLVTCGAGSLSGVVRASHRAMAEETGLDPRAVVDSLRALIARHFIVPYSLDDHLALVDVWAVPAILDHTPIPNGNVGKKVVKELADLMDGGAGAFWLALGVALKNNGGDRFLPELVETMIDRGRIEPIGDDRCDAVALAFNTLMGPVEDDAAIAESLGPAAPIRDEPLPPWAALVDAWNGSPKASPAGPLEYFWLPIAEDLMREATARVGQLGGVDKIPTLMAKIEASDFLLGKRANRDGELYTLTFAAMCRESMFLKIMEGAYDNPPAPKGVANP